MEKKPLIPIDNGPLDVWYESPSVMAVKKPKGMKVHPDKQTENGTLLNLLFQHNRWLANMENSTSAGVLHLYEPNDHGLMLFNKNEDYAEDLKKGMDNNSINFSYLVTVRGEYHVEIPAEAHISMTIHSQNQFAGYTILDITATTGDTVAFRDALFSDLEMSNITFYCYQISLTLPHSGEEHTISLKSPSENIPNIVVYHAPP